MRLKLWWNSFMNVRIIFSFSLCFSLCLSLSVILVSCRDKETDEKPVETITPPAVRVNFLNRVGDSAIVAGHFYNRDGGEPFSLDLFKYYISHAALVNDAGDTLYLNEHTLIDEFDVNRRGFSSNPSIEGLSSSHFNKIIFALGVDQLHNTSGDQAGDLDPVYGMIWTWSTGYIFLKHEGQFLSSTGTSEPLLYHYGTMKAFTPITLPVDIHLENEKQFNINVKFDLNKMYSAADAIGFEGNNVIQSTGPDDLPWILQMKANIAQSFSIIN
jgi:hypothetical protein